jgi:acyl-coenzyme A synthetase/AMP-(fatty) acid ligase
MPPPALIPLLHPDSDDLALIDADGDMWTHAELAGEVAERAASLKGRKSLVFCRCEMDARTVVDYLSALQAGHAVAMVDGGLAPELLSELCERYQPALVLGPDGTEGRKGKARPHEDLALLLSTSASTGSPKLVRLSAGAVEANAVSIALYLELGPEERAIASLPFHYSYGLSVLNSHLLAGGAVVLPKGGVMQAGFWSAFERHDCTSFAGVPYSYELLRRSGWHPGGLSSLRTMTQAGGGLAPERALELHNELGLRGARLVVMYGQTEATARIAWVPPTWLDDKPGSIGIPIPGGELEIDGGELVYRGANVMMGYATELDDLALGDKLGGVLRTGDLGHRDDDGFFWVTGRSQRFAKVYGLRINLDEVERALPVHCAAVGADERGITVFAVGGDPEELRTRLADRFRLRARTFEVRGVEQLPTTASGKIDYSALAL